MHFLTVLVVVVTLQVVSLFTCDSVKANIAGEKGLAQVSSTL